MNNRQKITTARYILLFVGVLIFVVVIVFVSILSRTRAGVLTVAFLDVGQGDAIYIETPSGNQLLLDGGNGRAVLRELGSSMPYFDHHIDVVMISHPDLDHIGGLPEVFKRFDIGMFLEPGMESDSSEYVALLVGIDVEGLTRTSVRRGMRLMLDHDVVLSVLFPDRDATHLESNTGSIVARLTYKNTSFLFTGDSPAGIENYLASVYGSELKSDVLKLGHHGSKTSSSDIFLGYVDPTYAVISVGCENTYGHPHQEIVDRLEQFGIQKFSTCHDGTITFTSDGETVSFK